jgi:hypothetical protein
MLRCLLLLRPYVITDFLNPFPLDRDVIYRRFHSNRRMKILGVTTIHVQSDKCNGRPFFWSEEEVLPLIFHLLLGCGISLVHGDSPLDVLSVSDQL